MAATDVTDNDVEWGTASTITVDKAGEYKNAKTGATHYVFGGAYYAREISVKYVPFDNTNLAPVVYTFNLTVKSEIFEGTLEYVKATYKTVNGAEVFDKYVAGDVKEINGAAVTLTKDEILAKDVYGIAYDITTDDRLVLDDVKLVLADDNANQYLKISGDWTNGWTIAKASHNTAIVTPPTCTVQVQVVDQWGKTKTVDVQVKVVK